MRLFFIFFLVCGGKHTTSLCVSCWIVTSSFKKYGLLEAMLFEVTLHQCRLQESLAACFPFLSSVSQMGVFPLKTHQAAIAHVVFLLIILTQGLKIETLLRSHYSEDGKYVANIVTPPLSHPWQTLLNDHIALSHQVLMQRWNRCHDNHEWIGVGMS